MKTLLAFIPNPTDATSFYRAVGPLQALKKKMGFMLAVGTEAHWASLKGADTVFIQRGYNDNHVKAVDLALDNGKKVWVDYDDDLFSVPRSNRTHIVYDDLKNQNNVVQILMKADVVTVSTPFLKNRFVKILEECASRAPQLAIDYNIKADKFHVIPNAYDFDFVKHYRKGKRKEKQNKLITWRGSETHDKDLLSVTPELVDVFSKHLDWTLNFVGSPFWLTIEKLQNIPRIKPQSVIQTASLDPAQFWKFLWETSPGAVFAPLWDCDFNRSKSNIAWIEGIHAGAFCIAPDFEEWQRPGVINYKTPEDFHNILDRYMRGEFSGEQFARDGEQYIMDNLTLDRVNILRETLLSELWE